MAKSSKRPWPEKGSLPIALGMTMQDGRLFFSCQWQRVSGSLVVESLTQKKWLKKVLAVRRRSIFVTILDEENVRTLATRAQGTARHKG